jgi:hypothetical protein
MTNANSERFFWLSKRWMMRRQKSLRKLVLSSKWIFGEIKEAGYSRYINPAAVRRIVDGGSVSKTSKIGEIKYGFARQRFSGGGNTRQLWAGFEFGSKKFKQFPQYSGRFGKGGRGWFIYPTLRKNQPELIRRWNEKFDEILKIWGRGE